MAKDAIASFVSAMQDGKVPDLASANAYNVLADHVGWLTPDGVHYPCPWWDHDAYAHEKLNSSVIELEAAGWARVTILNGRLDPLMGRGKELTEAQAEWLLGTGYV